MGHDGSCNNDDNSKKEVVEENAGNGNGNGVANGNNATRVKMTKAVTRII